MRSPVKSKLSPIKFRPIKFRLYSASLLGIALHLPIFWLKPMVGPRSRLPKLTPIADLN